MRPEASDIVTTATTSPKPVLSGADIPRSVHINAIGANHAHKRELDDRAIAKADLIFVDSLAQSKQEAGDLIVPFEKEPQRWAQVHELADLVRGKVPGRAVIHKLHSSNPTGLPHGIWLRPSLFTMPRGLSIAEPRFHFLPR